MTTRKEVSFIERLEANHALLFRRNFYAVYTLAICMRCVNLSATSSVGADRDNIVIHELGCCGSQSATCGSES
jgi:hypothetical protein